MLLASYYSAGAFLNRITSSLHNTIIQSPSGANTQQILQVRFRYHYLRRRTRVKRDILRHEAAAELEIPRLVYKAIHRDQRLDLKTRLQAMLALQSMHRYAFSTALKPRCVETGRGGGYMKGFRMSRIVFREAAINGKLAGMIRAVW
eukprot:Partr_v1_DN28668_c1_g1_i1_m50287 putative ribosomal protein